MKDNFQNRSPGNKTFVYLAGAFILVMALALSMVIQPVMASPAAQDGTATVTATVGDVGTLTPTVSGTETVVATATVAATATATVVATATRAATLAPPGTTGTPTALVPVTGADLTPPGEQSRMAVRIGLALLGLLLIGFGLRSYRTGKR